MKKTTVIMIMLLLTFILMTTGCRNHSTPAETTITPVGAGTTEARIEETTRQYYDTAGRKYEGYVFRVLNLDNVTGNGWTDIPNDVSVESETGDVLNDAVYRRNLTISDALEVKIVCTDLITNNYHSQVQSMVAAGDDAVDLMFIRQASLPTMGTKGQLIDLNTVKSLHFDEPWWKSNFIESMSVKQRLFAAVSEATYYDKLSTYVTFFNSKLATDYKLGDLYGLVSSGKWTLDRLLDSGKDFSADLNSDGVRDEKDTYPLSCQNDAAYILLNSAGIPICTKNEDDELLFNLTDEKAVSVLMKIYELMNDRTKFFNRQDIPNFTLQQAIQRFAEDGAMFMIRPVQSLFNMRSMQSDFGILPVPKFEEEQTNYTSSINLYTSTAAAFPVTVRDPERSAVVLSVMACESFYSVTPALYETVLGNKLIRDERSAEMLDITFGNTLYDPGLIWNFGGITETLLKNRSTNIASLIAGVTSKINESIKTTTEQLTVQQ